MAAAAAPGKKKKKKGEEDVQEVNLNDFWLRKELKMSQCNVCLSGTNMSRAIIFHRTFSLLCLSWVS